MRGMSMDNILGDPFALATISIAMVCYFKGVDAYAAPHSYMQWLLT